MSARAWIALWTVYILWGSTYLGIELAGETIPPILAAGIRFTTVGVVLVGWLLARHGTTPFRLGWVRAGSTILCGLLLIGGNALLFVAERRVPIGLASLIFASVPLWLVAHVPLGTVATYAYVNPLVAITLGILFLDEVITWQIAAGAAVILTSVAVVIRREVPRRPGAVIPPLVES